MLAYRAYGETLFAYYPMCRAHDQGNKAASKLANILFTKELQRRLDEENVPIIVMAVHPGDIATGTQTHHHITTPRPPTRLNSYTPALPDKLVESSTLR